jgi:hypothetical protein
MPPKPISKGAKPASRPTSRAKPASARTTAENPLPQETSRQLRSATVEDEPRQLRSSAGLAKHSALEVVIKKKKPVQTGTDKTTPTGDIDTESNNEQQNEEEEEPPGEEGGNSKAIHSSKPTVSNLYYTTVISTDLQLLLAWSDVHRS